MAATIYTDGQYAAANPTWHSEDSPWKAKHVYQLIEKHDLRPVSIAEIGCGVGGVIGDLSLRRAFRSRLEGCTFRGYDIAPEAIAIARSSYRHSIVEFVEGDLLTVDETFDLLLCIDVFEHIPDYLGFLSACATKARWHIYHVPLEIHVSSVLRRSVTSARQRVGHLHYFTAESALAALRDTGHCIRDYIYTESALALFHLHPSFERAIANIPRFVVSRFSQALSARLLGGYSLLVLCGT